MIRYVVIILLIMALSTLNTIGQTPIRTELVNLDGSKIYYEVYGKGEPLFLLHGFTQSSKSWYPFIKYYQNSYELYLIDLKGHGNSEMFSDTLSISKAANDIGSLCRHLKFESIKAIGFSYGGDILLVSGVGPGSYIDYSWYSLFFLLLFSTAKKVYSNKNKFSSYFFYVFSWIHAYVKRIKPFA